MGKLQKSSGNFAPCPEGLYQAVVVDMIDEGWEESFYNGKSKGYKPKVKIVFAVNELNDDEKPYLIFSSKLTLSADKKASLRKMLDGWLSKKVVDDALENDTFEMEALMGMNARLQVVHNPSEDGSTIFANIGALLPWNEAKDGPLLPTTITDYTRRQDRDDYSPPAVSAYDMYTPEKAREGSNVAQAEAINKKAAANGTASPAPAPSPFSAAATPTGPIKAGTMAKLIQIANQKWGAAKAMDSLNDWLGCDVDSLTNEEACARIQPLAEYVVPPSAEVDDGTDPFEDEENNPEPMGAPMVIGAAKAEAAAQ